MISKEGQAINLFVPTSVDCITIKSSYIRKSYIYHKFCFEDGSSSSDSEYAKSYNTLTECFRIEFLNIRKIKSKNHACFDVGFQ